MAKSKNDERIKCDYCGNYATRNIQEAIITWSIDKKGNYSKKPVSYEETCGDNFHLCDDCEPQY